MDTPDTMNAPPPSGPSTRPRSEPIVGPGRLEFLDPRLEDPRRPAWRGHLDAVTKLLAIAAALGTAVLYLAGFIGLPGRVQALELRMTTVERNAQLSSYIQCVQVRKHDPELVAASVCEPVVRQGPPALVAP